MIGIAIIRRLFGAGLAILLAMALGACAGKLAGKPKVIRLDNSDQQKLMKFARNHPAMKKMIDKYGLPTFRMEQGPKWVFYVYPMRDRIFYFYKSQRGLIARGKKYLSRSAYYMAIRFQDMKH